MSEPVRVAAGMLRDLTNVEEGARRRHPTLIGEVVADRMPMGARVLRVRGWLSQFGFVVTDALLEMLARCDSGAEVMFCWPLAKRPEVQVTADALVYGKVSLAPQVSVKGYRVDFVATKERFRLGIEIDGYAYHHTTEQQVQDDYLRQRRLVVSGLAVVRYTAREVFADPEAAWRQVEMILEANTRA